MRAADLDAEEHARREQDDDGGEERDPEVGDRLAEDQLPGAQRGDAQLLHRPALLLAHDRERGREHGGQHQQEADQAGHQELGRLELGVEEDARLEGERRRRRPGPPARSVAATSVGVLLGRRGRGRSRGRSWPVVESAPSSRSWTAARAAGGEVAAVALRDDEHGAGHAAARVSASRSLARPGRRDQVEVGRVRERRDELAARRAAVAVLDGEAHVADVEVEGEAVEHEHEGRAARSA